jgi:hypothetical protein
MGKDPASVIYWLTAVVVLAYTYETYCLRLEMVRQNEISIQPLLVMSIAKRPASGPSGSAGTADVLVIRNIGRGPALFIHVDDIAIILTGQSEPDYVVKLDSVAYLEPATKAVAQAVFYSKDGDKLTEHFNYLPNLHPKYAVLTHEIALHYEDVSRRQRYSLMQMGKKGVRLLRHGPGDP